VHGGESLGDEMDGEVGAAHPQVSDEVPRLVHALYLKIHSHKSAVSHNFKHTLRYPKKLRSHKKEYLKTQVNISTVRQQKQHREK